MALEGQSPQTKKCGQRGQRGGAGRSTAFRNGLVHLNNQSGMSTAGLRDSWPICSCHQILPQSGKMNGIRNLNSPPGSAPVSHIHKATDAQTRILLLIYAR